MLTKRFFNWIVLIGFTWGGASTSVADTYPFQKAFSCPIILSQFKTYQDHLRVMEGHFQQSEETRARLETLAERALYETTPSKPSVATFVAGGAVSKLYPWTRKKIAGRIAHFTQQLKQPAIGSNGGYLSAATLHGQDRIVDYLQSLAKKVQSEMQVMEKTGLQVQRNQNLVATGVVLSLVGATFFGHHLAEVLNGDPTQIKKMMVSGFLSAIGHSILTSETRKTDQILENFLDQVADDIQTQPREATVIASSQTYKILPSTWRSAFHNQGELNRSTNLVKDQTAMYYGAPFNTETLTRWISQMNPEEKPLYVTIDLIYERSAIESSETSLNIIVRSSPQPLKLNTQL